MNVNETPGRSERSAEQNSVSPACHGYNMLIIGKIAINPGRR